MADIISFDVKLTPNQKKAQDKLNQVHQLYDEIEKLLGTQDVFKKPHLFMELPPKEQQNNEVDRLNGVDVLKVMQAIKKTHTNFDRITASPEALAKFIVRERRLTCICATSYETWLAWLNQESKRL